MELKEWFSEPFPSLELCDLPTLACFSPTNSPLLNAYATDIMNVFNLFLVVNFIKMMDAEKFPKLAAYYELLTTHAGFKKAYGIPL